MKPKIFTTTFQKVELAAAKSGTCPVCGKTATRKQTFYQTVNPFNKNAKGEPKQGWEIIEELRSQIAAWRNQPTYHAKCEG